MSCNQEIKRQLTDALEALRLKKGLSLVEVCQQAKLTLFARKRIEYHQSISWKQCNRLCKYYGCRIEVKLLD